jgi:large subunit ribosomal protein L22
MKKVSRKSENHAPNRVSVTMVRISPRKARIIVDMVRGKDVFDALRELRFTHKKAARIVEKLIESVLSNIEASSKWDVEDLRVSKAWVNEGPTLRRFSPRAMGRATRIRKRTSHIHLVLEPEAAESDRR